jgi:predicted metal-dependent HD superfamily phosphohydrolase
MLQHTFTELLEKYTTDADLISTFWQEIKQRHSGERRFYHTLDHLKNLLSQLSKVKDQIRDWDVVLFTLFYHDVIYNSKKSDNEEQSAKLAEKRMKELSLPEDMIQTCVQQILATKSHEISENNDTNLFTDADLSILGRPWEEYWNYAQNVRKEYGQYPKIIYRSGRKKVLRHFLEMERIFKTDHFFEKYEEQARANLERELKQL